MCPSYHVPTVHSPLLTDSSVDQASSTCGPSSPGPPSSLPCALASLRATRGESGGESSRASSEEIDTYQGSRGFGDQSTIGQEDQSTIGPEGAPRREGTQREPGGSGGRRGRVRWPAAQRPGSHTAGGSQPAASASTAGAGGAGRSQPPPHCAPPQLRHRRSVPPPPPSRTNWTRLVPRPVLNGHVSSVRQSAGMTGCRYS